MNKDTVNSLCSCLTSWTQLHTLVLGCNDLSEMGHVVAQSLPVSIQVLNLSNCKLTGKAVTALGQRLSSLECLKELALSSNSLSGQCTGMLLPQSIEVLELCHCKLARDDMCSLAKQLPQLPNLTLVDLPGNPQTDVTAWKAFIECLPRCKSGLWLWLMDCGTDDDIEYRLIQSNTGVNVEFAWP